MNQFTACPFCNFSLVVEEDIFFHPVLERMDRFTEMWCEKNTDCKYYFYCSSQAGSDKLATMNFYLDNLLEVSILFEPGQMKLTHTDGNAILIDEILELDFPELLSLKEKLRLFVAFS